MNIHNKFLELREAERWIWIERAVDSAMAKPAWAKVISAIENNEKRVERFFNALGARLWYCDECERRAKAAKVSKISP